MQLGNWHHKHKRERKTFLSALGSSTALCHEIPQDPSGITLQVCMIRKPLELGLEIIQRITYSAWPLLTRGVLFILFLMLSANLKIQATPSTSSSLERKAKPTWINFVFTLYNVPVDWFGKCWEGWTNALQSHLDNGHTELKYPCHCRAYPKYLGTRWNCRTTLQPWL